MELNYNIESPGQDCLSEAIVHFVQEMSNSFFYLFIIITSWAELSQAQKSLVCLENLFNLTGTQLAKSNSIKTRFLSKSYSSMGNLILTNSAFWIFFLRPVVPKIWLILFLSWLKLESELGNKR